ncbi:hypothetical protein F4781DRAFT_439486 [Annulohypoxylon bovei var. microspora]|nr:hypothetical protein F4781DRAFT_439486 [Annulohypoxylon bovei var. microspora]
MGHSYPTTRIGFILIGAMLLHLATGTVWAQFCDDEACSVNCGISVSVENPACLSKEWDRNSIRLHGQDVVSNYLVHSPDEACSCQNDCTSIPGTGLPTCVDISKKATSQSYRFQITTCKGDEAGPGEEIGDNCPSSSSAVLLAPTTLLPSTVNKRGQDLNITSTRVWG